MLDKPTASHTLGLDFDDFSLKGASLSFASNKIKVDELFDFFVETANSDEANVKLFYNEEEKLHISALSNTHLVITAADTTDVLVRPLDTLLTKNKDIDASLDFQVEPILPYPLDQAVLDKILLSKDKEGSKLSVFILRKDHLLSHLTKWKTLGIESEIVTASSQALALFANIFSNSDKPSYIVHIGIENSFCILLDQKKLIAAQAIPSGIKNILTIYSEESRQDFKTTYQQFKSGQFSLQADLFLKSRLQQAVETLRLNITRTVFALAKASKNKDIDEIMITGPGTLIGGLIEAYSASLNKIERQVNSNLNINSSREDLLFYALPIGEALSGLPNVQDQINFRSQEFAYPEPWKRLKTPLLQYFACLFLVAVAIVIFGKAYVLYEEGETKRHYLELLVAMNKPYNEFEKEYKNKTNRQDIASDSETLPLSKLSLKDIENRLAILEKDIQSTPQIFPLKPNAPLAIDTLTWILNQFNLVENKEAGNEESFHIEAFSYTMVKRPEPSKKQEKYQIKVELEFSSLKPKLAREFHDILIAPNDIVDPKGEIKWGSNKDLYRTSFYLKDKTPYPNL